MGNPVTSEKFAASCRRGHKSKHRPAESGNRPGAEKEYLGNKNGSSKLRGGPQA
jgi:hypothetical protein